MCSISASSFSAGSAGRAGCVVGSSDLDFYTGTTNLTALGNESSWTGNKAYSSARTPYIQSQRAGNKRSDLFRVYSRSHGTEINTTYKLKILNIKPEEDIEGSDYGTFSLHVVKVSNDEKVEEFDESRIYAVRRLNEIMESKGRY